MRFGLCSFIVLLIFIESLSAWRLHQVKHGRLVKVRKLRDVARTTVIQRGNLADGTPFEKIQEHGKDLPPLPIQDDRGVDGGEDIMVPVDDNGKVLPEFEYLLKPIVIEIDVPKGGKVLNAEIKQDESESIRKVQPNVMKNSVDDNDNDDGEYADEGDYENVGTKELPEAIPSLPPPEYSDSGESDENMAPIENESGEADEQIDDKTIDIPHNKIDNDVEPSDVTKNNNENVLMPSDKEIEPKPIPYESEDEELTDEDIQMLANDMGKEVLENIMNKASEIAGIDSAFESDDSKDDVVTNKDKEISTMDNDGKTVELEGHILEDPGLSEEEKQKIKEESEGKVIDQQTINPPIVRGGRVAPKPDSASTAATFISISLTLFTALNVL